MRFRFDKSMNKKLRGKGGIILSNKRCTFESPVACVSEDFGREGAKRSTTTGLRTCCVIANGIFSLS